jgi:hypothetical protein
VPLDRAIAFAPRRMQPSLPNMLLKRLHETSYRLAPFPSASVLPKFAAAVAADLEAEQPTLNPHDQWDYSKQEMCVLRPPRPPALDTDTNAPHRHVQSRPHTTQTRAEPTSICT